MGNIPQMVINIFRPHKTAYISTVIAGRYRA